MSFESQFSDERVDLSVLRRRAFNQRWATQPADVIALTAAEPDFPVAPEIVAAVREYIDFGYFSYGPAEGLPEFRAAAATAVRERWGVDTGPDCILATDSAAAAMFHVARFALDPGDEAIIFDPVDFLFAASVEAAGGRPVRCPIDPVTRTFDVDDLKRRVTPSTRLLCICDPHNPLGRVMNEDELNAFAELALEHDLWVMSDQVWADIVYEPVSLRGIASIGDEIAQRTLIVYGFSKSYGLAGPRIGFVAAPRDVIERLVDVSRARTTATGAATISQIAAIAALERAGPWLDAFRSHLTEMRDYTVGRLNEIPGFTCRTPEATYVAFADISATGRTSEQIADLLHEQARVAVVPGTARWFGAGAEGHIRISFATSRAIMSEALDRVHSTVTALTRSG